MKITVTDIPEKITGLFFSPSAIISDNEVCSYLEKMLPFIFGKTTVAAAGKLEIDIFDLVFVKEKPFCDYFNMRVKKCYGRPAILKTALLLRLLFKGSYIKIAKLGIIEDSIFVKEPEFITLSIIDTAHNYTRINEKITRKSERNKLKNLPLNKRSEHILFTVDIAVVKNLMKKGPEYKELMDKYNFRRFSSDLRINNRPATLGEVNHLLSGRKKYTFADLSDTKLRLEFTALYAMAYGGFTLDELFGQKAVFEDSSPERDEKLSRCSSDFITIVLNGNGIEIAGMLVNMITALAECDLPALELSNLKSLMENYTVYCAVASLSALCLDIFSLNENFKSFMRKKIIGSYWNYTNKLMLMKQYYSAANLCKKLAELNLEAYRDIPAYRNEITDAFDEAEKLAEEIKAAETGKEE
ncbi:MAG: hypothetical protein ACI4J7_06395 [Ruminiclostridium sp.]